MDAQSVKTVEESGRIRGYDAPIRELPLSSLDFLEFLLYIMHNN